MMLLIPLVTLFGCDQTNDAPPTRILGLWQVHEVETSTRPIPGEEVALSNFPGCNWARQTWNFSEEMLRVEHDVLCPAGPRGDEYVGCQVAAEVPARWDQAASKWIVETSVRARSRAVALQPSALTIPTACTARIDAGDYQVARMPPRQEWAWEMGVPNGTVLRLKIPESEEPDFVAAMRTAAGLDLPAEDSP